MIRAPGPTEGLRIGLLGGSFNPAHDGHVHASLLALKQLGLDYVWWLVSPQNPLKPIQGMAPLAARLDDARSFATHPRIVVTGIEAGLGTVYTADTLTRLNRRFPRARFVWLMGSDNLLQLPRWRRWQAILRTLPVAVVTRPGSALRARFGKVAGVLCRHVHPPDTFFASRTAPALTILDGPRNPQSATALRRKASL